MTELPQGTLSHLKVLDLSRILAGNPIKFSRTPVEYRDAPPTLGQHTAEVLSGLEKQAD